MYLFIPQPLQFRLQIVPFKQDKNGNNDKNKKQNWNYSHDKYKST